MDWAPCAALPSPLGEERITTCDDIAAILRTQGALVARLLRPGRYDGFRLYARTLTRAELVGGAEWYVSPETGAYLRCPGAEWSACDYGQHDHHLGDGPTVGNIRLAA
ncbi:hypothetical protein [Streptomyces sp. CB02923]|uniref:hypothetical protein n=1 Tax=Streptomyces sp. CB02923 TaxID=1718985 RepID=UPI0019013E24|nr:hypothetical protein [Streptomyces sp. CB02923]